MAVDHAQEVFGVGADVHIIVAVYPEPAHHQHPGFLAPDILQDLFEGLAVEQRGLDVHALGLRDFSGNVEMGLVDFRQAAVDDLLVQFLLLLEAEHLARLFIQHARDAVKRGVMEIRIER